MRWDAKDIALFLKHTGWLQRELAEKVGTTQQVVSDWALAKHRPSKAFSKFLDLLAAKVRFHRGA